MADLGVQPHVIEAVLNHVSGHKAGVAGICNRSTYAAEKRVALDLWANHLLVAVAKSEGANVTKLRQNAQIDIKLMRNARGTSEDISSYVVCRRLSSGYKLFDLVRYFLLKVMKLFFPDGYGRFAIRVIFHCYPQFGNLSTQM